jgi:hypothetical protein
VLEKKEGEVKVHYLPYKTSNRDEWISESEESLQRMAMAFTHSTQMNDDKDTAF